MLVLSRKSMERIQIGDSFVVTVLQIRGDRIRIGIDAPQEIRVIRAQLHDGTSERPVRSAPAAGLID